MVVLVIVREADDGGDNGFVWLCPHNWVGLLFL